MGDTANVVGLMGPAGSNPAISEIRRMETSPSTPPRNPFPSCGPIIPPHGIANYQDYPFGKFEAAYHFIEPHVLLMENALPFADQLMLNADTLAWVNSTVVGDVTKMSSYTDTAYRNSSYITIDHRMPDVLAGMTFIGNAAVSLYQARHPFAKVDGPDGLYQLLRYGSGQHFHEHHDFIHRHPHPRILSLVAYPNDDYDGGDLVFPQQNLRVKPRKGSVIVFPSAFTHSHASLDVTKGIKYSIVTWFI